MLADNLGAAQANSRVTPQVRPMMSPNAALTDPIFRAYLVIVPLSLVVGGIILVVLQYGFRKELGSIWLTYRSWIVMAAIGLIFVGLGRLAVIAGVTLLSL